MSPSDILEEIGNLAGLDLHALRHRWQIAFGSEAPGTMSREILIQAVAYRIQEKAFGGLPHSLREQLDQSSGKRTGPSVSVSRRYKQGTRFIREWQGRSHEVVATGDGTFSYNNKRYRSLSSIAREITGTRWSGPAFFGLTAAKET